MKGFCTDAARDTLDNTDYRRVLYTGQYSQLVLMALVPGEEIGQETHQDNDQFFQFESGQGQVVIDGKAYEVGTGSAVIVPAGATHNVINTSSDEPLKLYTVYSPPNHKDGLVRPTKQEADANPAAFDGQTTE